MITNKLLTVHQQGCCSQRIHVSSPSIFHEPVDEGIDHEDEDQAFEGQFRSRLNSQNRLQHAPGFIPSLALG
jgi:hypothetical protein